MNRSEAMRDQKIGPLLLSFSLPAIVGMLVNSLYNVVSRIFIGQGVDHLALAGITLAFPIMIILMAVSMLFGIGATALISIRLGENKKAQAEKVAANAAAMLVILPGLMALGFGLFAEPILVLFGASGDVLPYAKDYISIIMVGAIFGSISMGMNNFIRAEGNPKMAMNTQILGAVVNIILHYIFIFNLGAGIKGAAWATVIAQFASASWVVGYYFTGKSLIKFRWKNFKPQWSILLGVSAIGFSPFAMQIAFSIQQLILNKTLMYHSGDLALSAAGILMAVSTLLVMPIIGISQGAQPIIGYNYGAGQYQRVKETVKLAIAAGTGIAVLGFLTLRIWPLEIATLFTTDEQLITLTAHAMLVFLAALPVIGFQIICSNYFQAVGKAREAAVLSLSRQVLFFIPLLLILPRFWGIEGAWRASPIADLLATTLTAAMIYRELKKINKELVATPRQDVIYS